MMRFINTVVTACGVVAIPFILGYQFGMDGAAIGLVISIVASMFKEV